MAIKILGGYFKGISLNSPSSKLEEVLRPTSVLLRRKIYDRYQNLSDYHFVDICAGTGCMGLEALSRGAKSCLFIDKNQAAEQLIKSNIELIKARDSQVETEVWKTALVKSWDRLKKYVTEHEQSILFFDPPYEDHDLYKQFASFISEVSFTGLSWIEFDKQKAPDIRELQKLLGPPEKEYHHSGKYIWVFSHS